MPFEQKYLIEPLNVFKESSEQKIFEGVSSSFSIKDYFDFAEKPSNETKLAKDRVAFIIYETKMMKIKKPELFQHIAETSEKEGELEKIQEIMKNIQAEKHTLKNKNYYYKKANIFKLQYISKSMPIIDKFEKPAYKKMIEKTIEEKVKTIRTPQSIRITFPNEIEEDKGFPIILYGGTLASTDEERTYVVETKTLKDLDNAGIKYTLPKWYKKP